jgi:hypothetical protein
METEKANRLYRRDKAREKATNSGIQILVDAAILAKKGYGVEDLRSLTGCPEGFAREMVLGID